MNMVLVKEPTGGLLTLEIILEPIDQQVLESITSLFVSIPGVKIRTMPSSLQASIIDDTAREIIVYIKL